MRKISIVLADDHNVVREGLRVLLAAEPDFSVAGEVSDGVETVRLVERIKPNVLVVDLMMPGLNGLEVTRQLRQRAPETRVILLSMHANEAYVLEALRNGAGGYVLKDSTAADLVKAIRAVAAGHKYLSAPFSDSAIEAYLQKAKEAPLEPHETLTSREREVLQLVAEGRTSAEIARRLFISVRTVEVHRAHLMRKLGFHSQTDLIRYALTHGILPMTTGRSPRVPRFPRD
jgi:two-component system response regulator NreC